MHLIKHWWRCANFRRFAQNVHSRCASSSGSSHAANRVVLISTSDSIYENLALEEWMYETTDFSQTDFLLMWRNKPAVVFGRHQNPWLEANIPAASMDGVDIARRSSGGGTVYHDEGNLNLSFLKTRLRYNRKENLHLVVDAVRSKWDLDLTVNDRDDIVLDHFYKVSGTAAKLGRTQSFHHFTLLLGVDTSRLSRLLDSPMQGVDSKATKSVPASVRNLQENVPDMTFELLVNVIGRRFLQRKDQQKSHEHVRFIDPVNEADFPGVKDILRRLKSWDWIYGKTPKFSLCRTFSGHEFQGHVCTLIININIEKGRVVSIYLQLNNEKLDLLVAALNIFYTENVQDVILTDQSLSHLREKCLTHFETLLCSESTEVLSVARWIIRHKSHEHVRFIDPVNEADFPGVKDILRRLKSWDWIYGKTPKFSLCRTFSGHEFQGHVCTLIININIEKGRVVSIYLQLNNEKLDLLVAALNIFYTENVQDVILTDQSLSHLREKCLTHFETLLCSESTEVLSVASHQVTSPDNHIYKSPIRRKLLISADRINTQEMFIKRSVQHVQNRENYFGLYMFEDKRYGDVNKLQLTAAFFGYTHIDI